VYLTKKLQIVQSKFLLYEKKILRCLKMKQHIMKLDIFETLNIMRILETTVTLTAINNISCDHNGFISIIKIV